MNDAAEVLKKVVTGSDGLIDVFLIGHSLGAAVLAALPNELRDTNNIKFSGLVMVDIIEGNLHFSIFSL